MDALCDQIAAAVTAELNSAPGGTFGVEFVARQLDVPDFDIGDLASLQVTVSDASITLEPANRAADWHQYDIHIGVQQCVSDDASSVKPLKLLLQQMMDYMRRRPLAAVPEAKYVRARYVSHRAPDHLREHRVFTGVIALTYQMLR